MWPCLVPAMFSRGLPRTPGCSVCPSGTAPVLRGEGGRGLLPIPDPTSRRSAQLDAECGGSILPVPPSEVGALKPSSGLAVPGWARSVTAGPRHDEPCPWHSPPAAARLAFWCHLRQLLPVSAATCRAVGAALPPSLCSRTNRDRSCPSPTLLPGVPPQCCRALGARAPWPPRQGWHRERSPNGSWQGDG